MIEPNRLRTRADCTDLLRHALASRPRGDIASASTDAVTEVQIAKLAVGMTESELIRPRRCSVLQVCRPNFQLCPNAPHKTAHIGLLARLAGARIGSGHGRANHPTRSRDVRPPGAERRCSCFVRGVRESLHGEPIKIKMNFCAQASQNENKFKLF